MAPIIHDSFGKRGQRMWMLRRFFVIIVFFTTSDKMTLITTLFGSFWKKILQNVTNRESFTNFKTIITKCDKNLLQSVTGVTKWDKKLFQSMRCIMKRGSYYKVRRNMDPLLVLSFYCSNNGGTQQGPLDYRSNAIESNTAFLHEEWIR